MQSSDETKQYHSPIPELHLTLNQLKDIRRHLFGDDAAALGGQLSDVQLVQLLVVSAGCNFLAAMGSSDHL